MKPSASTNLHSQATAYARLAELEAVKAGSVRGSVEEENLNYEFGDFSVLPVSAESAGFLPDRKGHKISLNHKSYIKCCFSSIMFVCTCILKATRYYFGVSLSHVLLLGSFGCMCFCELLSLASKLLMFI